MCGDTLVLQRSERSPADSRRWEKDLIAPADTGECLPSFSKSIADQRVMANLGLARVVARRCLMIFGPIIELEDLTQEANLALVRAAWGYDTTRAVCFSTYASRICWRACVDVLRPVALRRAQLPVCLAATERDLIAVNVDPMVGSEPNACHALIAELLRLGASVLTTAEREVIHARYCEGLTQASCGSQRGVSRQYVAKTESSALKKLAEAAGVGPKH